MRQFDDEDDVERDAAVEIIDKANTDTTKDKITFVQDEEGDWKIVVRVNGEGKAYLYQEVAYHLEPEDYQLDELFVQWANDIHQQTLKID